MQDVENFHNPVNMPRKLKIITIIENPKTLPAETFVKSSGFQIIIIGSFWVFYYYVCFLLEEQRNFIFFFHVLSPLCYNDICLSHNISIVEVLTGVYIHVH